MRLEEMPNENAPFSLLYIPGYAAYGFRGEGNKTSQSSNLDQVLYCGSIDYLALSRSSLETNTLAHLESVASII